MDTGQNRGFRKGVGHFKRKFQGKGLSTNDFWHQKTTVAGLSCGIVCVILRLAVLIQYWCVPDRHTMTANTHSSLAGK